MLGSDAGTLAWPVSNNTDITAGEITARLVLSPPTNTAPTTPVSAGTISVDSIVPRTNTEVGG